jgi:hypothetical protein
MANSTKRSSSSTSVSQSALKQALATLESLPDKPREHLSLRATIELLQDTINAALDKGYNYEEVSELLSRQGIHIAPSSLKYYMTRVRRKHLNGAEMAENIAKDTSDASGQMAEPIKAAAKQIGVPATTVEQIDQETAGVNNTSATSTTPKRSTTKSRSTKATQSSHAAPVTSSKSSTQTADTSDASAKSPRAHTANSTATSAKTAAQKPTPSTTKSKATTRTKTGSKSTGAKRGK